MKRSEVIFKDYFCGNRISDYGREHGRVDYATLAKAFDAVLNNEIMSAVGWENWEQVNGLVDNFDKIEMLNTEWHDIELDLDDPCLELDDEERAEKEERIEEIKEHIDELEQEEEQPEIFQYYIISGQGAEILKDYTGEIVFYNYELDMYVWGVTHFGTGWDYVLTDIRCEKETKTA